MRYIKINIRYGTIEKTGKKEFIEELMKNIPEGQEIKLATVELETTNEDKIKGKN